MRGAFVDQGGLFSYIAPEARVPANHPLRKIRELVRDRSLTGADCVLIEVLGYRPPITSALRLTHTGRGGGCASKMLSDPCLSVRKTRGPSKCGKGGAWVHKEIREALDRRLGRARAGKRIALESATRVGHSPDRLRLFGLWVSPEAIRTCLRFVGLYRRGLLNASAVEVRHSFIEAPIPDPFDQFTILHISDLHVDMNPGAVERIAGLLPHLNYNFCVMTGDYRGKSSGPFGTVIEGLAKLRTEIDAAVYAVLGSGLIKSTIQGQRQGRRRPGNFAPTCRPILAATKEGDTPGLATIARPFRWTTLVRLTMVVRLTNTMACGAGRTTTATAGATMSEARTNTQKSGSS
jgi:hypothetical protein